MYQDIINFEKNFGGWLKLTAIFIASFFFFASNPAHINNPLLVKNFGAFILIHILYYLVLVKVIKQMETGHLLWLIISTIDLAFVAFLIYLTEGLNSNFFIFYAIFLLIILSAKPDIIEFLFFGFVGHITSVIALYAFYESMNFYFTISFWQQAIGLGIFFTGALLVMKELTKLKKLTITDSLTNTYNRYYLNYKLEKTVEKARELTIDLCLLMLDLDNFKEINDQLGHQVGDQVLISLTDYLKTEINNRGDIFRYGGDEFVIMLVGTSVSEGQRIATNLIDGIKNLNFTNNSSSIVQSLTASIGIAAFPYHAQDPYDLLKKADYSLVYGAKRSGDNSICVYSSNLEDKNVDYEIQSNFKEFKEKLELVLSCIESKDGYTGEHCKRVANFAKVLGEKMGLSSEKINTIWLAGMLHDIGKLELSENLLIKKGDINENEWQLIQQHPVRGVKMLQRMKLPYQTEITKAVAQHHERFDGSGYPKGLSGKEISLGGRILALADAFDAMQSFRPYNYALSKEEIIKELKDQRGKQFDPELTDLFLDYLDEIEESQQAI
ncbi:bifunctional diguanylate cyclase/phosphohydrolase [Fuchsiella alkaliacetigena]|uniref:bifunctional diguanylate cyclase/phosphohydrolase n=1 Tax=Fuchsiella alkaliacetigena TaxID=957042 RepID=UPI00200A4E9B|nr:diguanylate cyclase [Fuchsiella alkaliacetigena]MCK8825159.1 diguanylate cyclase [Fuchsiella alkaliacetigena]